MTWPCQRIVVLFGQMAHSEPHHENVPSLTQTNSAPENDPFWFVNGFDDSQMGNLDDAMDTEPDLMLAFDQNMGDNPSPAITWEQWDAWLAESNVMRPSTTAEAPRPAV